MSTPTKKYPHARAVSPDERRVERNERRGWGTGCGTAITKPETNITASLYNNTQWEHCDVCGRKARLMWRIGIDYGEDSRVCDDCFKGVAVRGAKPSLDYAADAYGRREEEAAYV